MPPRFARSARPARAVVASLRAIPSAVLVGWFSMLVGALPARAATSARRSQPSVVIHPRGGAAVPAWWDAETGVLVRTERVDATGSFRRELWSAVGPMIAERVRSESHEPGGVHPGAHDRLVVRGPAHATIDLEAFLAESGQSRAVIGHWLAALPADQRDDARCPAADTMPRGRTLGWWDRHLRETGCVRAAAHGFSPPGLSPRGYAVASWAPAKGTVDLLVTARAVQGAAAIEELSTIRITVRPPLRWLPWLDAARQGRGLLADDARWHAAGIASVAAFALLRRWQADGEHGALYLGQQRGSAWVVRAGVDNEPRLRVPFVGVRRLAADLAAANWDDPSGRHAVLRLDVASLSIDDAPRGRRRQRAALCRAAPPYCRGGGQFLLWVSTPVEGAWPAQSASNAP